MKDRYFSEALRVPVYDVTISCVLRVSSRIFEPLATDGQSKVVLIKLIANAIGSS